MNKLLQQISLVFFLILSGTVKLCAQDLHFSQYPWSPLNLGAASIGSMDADLRIAALHRSQWKSVPVPYSTFSIGAEAQLGALNEHLAGIGGGLLINQDKAGDGELQTLQITLAGSYSFPLSSDSIHFITTGISFGITQKSLDFNKLSFDNQFNEGGYNPIAPSGEIYDRTNYSFVDIGLSAGWLMKKEANRYRVGFQFNHLNRANQSYYSYEKVRLPVMFQLYSVLDLSMNDQLTLSPAISWMNQQKFNEVNLGLEAKFILKNETAKKYAVGLGVFYRANDAIIPLVSVYWNKFRVGFSYDVNVSAFNTATNGRGGPEFTLVYQAAAIKNRVHKNSPCPIY